MARCASCGENFASALQLGAHARTGCIEVPIFMIDENSEVPLFSDEDIIENATNVVITQPFSLNELATRQTGEWGRIHNVRAPVAPPPLGSPRDYRGVRVFFCLLNSFLNFFCFACSTVAAFVARVHSCRAPVLSWDILERVRICKELIHTVKR